MSDFRFPTISERVSVIGRTGSGKTQMGMWLLSNSAFDEMPWVVVDYKGDDLISGISRLKEISFNDAPDKPGLYVIRPEPDTDDAKMEIWLRRIWAREYCGLFFDECYMVPQKGGAFNGILTQGRSKRIPAICLTQRPSWISRFVFSEADHFSIFHLNDDDDWSKVRRFLPVGKDQPLLPEYNSLWYSVKNHELFQLQPVPSAEEILEKINTRLRPKRRLI